LKVLVFLQDAERRGVYRVDRSAALHKLVELLEYDGSSVLINGNENKTGLLLDYEADCLKNPYEIETWGTAPKG
jgi:hypothetical protein